MEELKFERTQADDGIHDAIEVNGVERPANICALAIIAGALAISAVGVVLLFAGVFG